MLVSHESPLCLLDKSLEYNDFDYALVHLFETNQRYYDFYKKCVKNNREVLLDNSLFELGKAFEPKQFIKWIEKLEPSVYVIPDVWQNAKATAENAKNWVKMYGNSLPGRTIGVVQGKTYDELKDCYTSLTQYVDEIAISFGYDYYLTCPGYAFYTPNAKVKKLMDLCIGRQSLIEELINDGTWCWDTSVHLLGASLAKEFRFYIDRDIYNIRSCDTSSPIMCGIKGIKYDFDFGNKTKPDGLLADHLDIELTAEQYELIDFNIKQFKRIRRR